LSRSGRTSAAFDGYVLERPMSPREAIDLLPRFTASTSWQARRLALRRSAREAGVPGDEDDLVSGKTASLVTLARAQEANCRRRSRFPSAILKTTFKWRESYPADSRAARRARVKRKPR
jgi:hypothetical protein